MACSPVRYCPMPSEPQNPGDLADVARSPAPRRCCPLPSATGRPLPVLGPPGEPGAAISPRAAAESPGSY